MRLLIFLFLISFIFKRRSMRKPPILYIWQNMWVNGFRIWPHRKLGFIAPYMNPKYYGLKIYFKRVRVCRTIWPQKKPYKMDKIELFCFLICFQINFPLIKFSHIAIDRAWLALQNCLYGIFQLYQNIGGKLKIR